MNESSLSMLAQIISYLSCLLIIFFKTVFENISKVEMIYLSMNTFFSSRYRLKTLKTLPSIDEDSSLFIGT